MRILWSLLFLIFQAASIWAQPLDRATLEPFVAPPYALGDAVNDKGVWSLQNSGGAQAGYVFETEIMAPLPGFSGAAINMLVMLDLDGRFIDVRLLSQNEPIFVSGLGEAPFRKFLEQYRGQSINAPMVVGSPYGDEAAGSGISYLEGVLKATASVRIAHESIMAATREVAREKMKGVNAAPPAQPNLGYDEALDWQALVDQEIARNIRVSNGELNAAFAGTRWADDDPDPGADPQGDFLNLWLIDIGPPAIARAVLDLASQKDLERFIKVSPFDEPFLVIDTGRHGLVGQDFVRNTAPDLLTATQDDLPVSLRDADLLFTTAPNVPQGAAMILRADRRLGFDPARDWTLNIKAIRAHGMFQPEIGSVDFSLVQATPERFFERPGAVELLSPWRESIRNRLPDLVLIAIALPLLFLALGPGMNRLAGLRHYTAIRLGILAIVTGFVGWWGQGQLSIVTPLATLRTSLQGGSFSYLLYDPFSLLIWGAAALGFWLWGRGLFCGWLCPFGALQEFAHHLGRVLHLPRWEPTPRWDNHLKRVKYVLLAGLIATAILAPDEIDTVVEVEPFKTAITTFFLREWPYVVYATAWLILGMFTFKGFCRYVCPLGALMAIGGLLRGRDWIARRKECGSPCQLCKVRCAYGAIKATGEIQYSECFQCLDCVTIHDDPNQCVPLILAAKAKRSLTTVGAK